MSSNASSSEAEESSDTDQNRQDASENQVQFPTKEDTQPEIITNGEFEQERQVSAEQAGQFLVDLGEQLQSGTELTLGDEEWELPVSIQEPVELDIEFEGYENELEVELEMDVETRSEDQ